MDVDIRRDGERYTLHFEKGENIGGLKREKYSKKDTGTRIHWRPDLQVFTDIDISKEYYIEIIKRQAIVNAGVTFIFRNQVGKNFETTEFKYDNGITDHVTELIGENGMTQVQTWKTERIVRDREDKPNIRLKSTLQWLFQIK